MPEASEKSPPEFEVCWYCLITVLAYFGAAAFVVERYHRDAFRPWMGWAFAIAMVLSFFWVMYRSHHDEHFHLFSGIGGFATTAVVACTSLNHFLGVGGPLVGASFFLLFVAGGAIAFAIIALLGRGQPTGRTSEAHHAVLATRFFVATIVWTILLDLIVQQSLNDRLLLLGVAIFSAISIPVVIWKTMQATQEGVRVSKDRFVIRTTPDGYIIIKPGEPYKAMPQDKVIVIRPDRQLFQTPAGPRMLQWQPDARNLSDYVEAYGPLRGAKARAQFIAGLEDFFKLNPRPTIEFLQDRYADHMGVQILTLDLPPGTEPSQQPRDTRSPAQRAIAIMRAKATSARELTAFWQSLPNDPDFAAAMKDDKARELLRGQFEQLMTDITEGRLP